MSDEKCPKCGACYVWTDEETQARHFACWTTVYAHGEIDRSTECNRRQVAALEEEKTGKKHGEPENDQQERLA